MKRGISFFVPLLLAINAIGASTAIADARVADCIELRAGTSTATSTLITLKVDVYATCTALQLGRGRGQLPVYEMPQEESLFNFGSCSGPAITQLIGNGWLGTATCSLRIGSNSLPSPRKGATSTNIKVWFAWDFSEKSVPVSHIAIPASTNNGWGGSPSGGSSDGSSGGVTIPATKNCAAAPNMPTLKKEWNSIGPKFTYSPQSSGEKATAFYWAYALWNSSSRSWEGWSSWTRANVATGTYQASVVQDKTKIAFSVYALNDCGASEEARESEDKKGIALVAQIQDTITGIPYPEVKFRVGQERPLSYFAISKLNLTLTAESSSATVCEVTTNSIIRLSSSGDCNLVFSSVTDGLNTAAPATSISLKVYPSKVEQIIPDIKLRDSYLLSDSQIELSLISSAGLIVEFESRTESVCSVVGNRILLRSSGQCVFWATQGGNENINSAIFKSFTFSVKNIQIPLPQSVATVTVAKKSITCIRGKLNKKVTALNPKCPAGYKKK